MSKFKNKSKVKSDIKLNTDDLINVVVGLFPDAHVAGYDVGAWSTNGK